MLARYKIYRGKRPAGQPAPDGIRQDTRKHTRHVLRPPTELVVAYLAQPPSISWEEFADGYLCMLQTRYEQARPSFDKLAQLATDNDVYIGCSCPTNKNPDVNHCHTLLALRFMDEHYPQLTVAYP